jgi:hypothetical protein
MTLYGNAALLLFYILLLAYPQAAQSQNEWSGVAGF